MLTLIAMLIGIFLDAIFSEPKRFHPLIGFGYYAGSIEAAFNITSLSPSSQSQDQNQWLKCKGLFAWCIAVLPIVLLAYLMQQAIDSFSILPTLFMAVMVYLAIGWRSLIQHAMTIYVPLSQGDIVASRHAVSMIVSRETEQMAEPEIVIAATESVLENGADAVFSALFWFLVLGVPGLVLYRLSNTLDAMWGYKNSRYQHFGFAAAKIDDVLNFVPARITALLYASASFNIKLFKQSIYCWRTQAKACASPNGGPVMCAGAGAINVQLGGFAIYHGQRVEKPLMGINTDITTDITAAANNDISDKSALNSEVILNACQLLNRSVYLSLVLIILAISLSYFIHH